MGDPGGFVDFVTNLSLGVPLLILGGASLGWWLTTRVAPPPSLAPTPRQRSWKQSPGSMAYAALAREQYLLPTFLLAERLTRLLGERPDLPTPEVRVRWGNRRLRESPLSRPVRAALRDLAVAYRAAYLAEGLPRRSPLAGGSSAGRRRRAAEEFERATDEVARVLDARGTPS